MFKVNNKEIRTTPGIVLVVSNVTFEHISHLVLVSTVNFEQVIAGWVKPTMGTSNLF